MKLTKLHLIIILALALILCPVLGVCYNSNSSINTYNYREGLGGYYTTLQEGMSGDGYPYNQVYEGMSGRSVDRVLTEGYTEHNPGWGLFSEGMSGQSVDRLLTEGFNGWEPRWEGFSEGMTTGDVLTEGMSHIPDIALQEGYNRHAR